MNMKELEKKYLGRKVSPARLGTLTYLGRFGQATLYQIVYDMNSYHITADIGVEDEAISGIVPEKTPVADYWGVMPEETDELTEDEVAVMAQYLDTVMLTETEIRAQQDHSVMGMGFGLEMMDYSDDDEEEEE